MYGFSKIHLSHREGGLAQLARALAWQARGRGFKSRILHWKFVVGQGSWQDANEVTLFEAHEQSKVHPRSPGAGRKEWE